MVGWIRDRARRAGLGLTPEAALLLMHTVGTEPAECMAEIGRLAAAGKRSLDVDDLRGELSCSFESTPFEFADALLGGDQRRALRSLEAMYRRGVRGRDGDTVDSGGVFPFVTSWLWQSLAKAHEGRFWLDRGVPLREVGAKVGVKAFLPRFQQQVSDNSTARLTRGLRLLHEAQRKLRTSGEEPEWLLRELVRGWFTEAAR